MKSQHRASGSGPEASGQGSVMILGRGSLSTPPHLPLSASARTAVLVLWEGFCLAKELQASLSRGACKSTVL